MKSRTNNSICKQPQELTAQLVHIGIQSTENIFKANPNGCNHCTHGYSGRTGIYEVMRFDDALSEALIKGASVHELEKLAISNGMNTLQMSGIEKLKQGVTSFSELQRVLYF